MNRLVALARPVRPQAVAASVGVRCKSTLRYSYKFPESFQPVETDGEWRSPRMSKRKAAVLRKEAERAGTVGVFDLKEQRGWLPEWGTMRMSTVQKPRRKQVAYDAKLAARIEGIQKKLAQQDNLVTEYRQELRTRKEKGAKPWYVKMRESTYWHIMSKSGGGKGLFYPGSK